MNQGEVEGVGRLVLSLIGGFIEAVEYVYRKLLAPGVTFAKRWFQEQWKVWRSEAWQVTEGSVEWANGSEESLHWSAEVAYSYKVSGAFYSGYNRVAFGRECDVKAYVAGHAPQTALYLRYKPTRPEVSLVLHCDQLCRVTPAPAVCEPVNRRRDIGRR